MFIVTFLRYIGALFQSLVGLVLPVLTKAGRARGVGSALRWILHVLVVAAILVGLYLLNVHYLHWGSNIGARWGFVRDAWCAILFFLGYLLFWVAWWLWQLLASTEEETDFPDIDAAWKKARAALDRKGLDITNLPLFLILGQPEGDEKAFFASDPLPLEVNQVPPEEDAPLHVYAHRKAVYISCPGASLLGRHAAILTSRAATSRPVDDEPPPEDDEDPLNKTMRPGQAAAPVRDMTHIMDQARREGRNLAMLTKAEKRELRTRYRADNPRTALLRNPEQVERLTARLQHLCRLIRRDRAPYCSLNGILLLVPFAGTDSDQDATDTGDLIRRDLASARGVLKIHCPVFAVLCDLETAPGFGEFIQRFNPKQRGQRVGQRCPLVPDLRESASPGANGGPSPLAKMLDSLAAWVCNSVVPDWVFQKFQIEPDGAQLPSVVNGNAQLFLFFDQLRDRRKRLGTILARGIAADAPEPLLFGGCYIAGTGSDSADEQAFVGGLFPRLLEEEENVSWSDQALDEEAASLRWAGIAYTVAGILVLVGVALIGYWWFFHNKG
jgi:hypothetical protein